MENGCNPFKNITNIYYLRAIFSKNGAISEVTVSDFSLFPVYQWWLYKTQKCQIFFLDLQRFSRYWCCKTHFMAPTNLTSKIKKAIFFKIHNGFQRNFLERLGICQGRPGDKYLVPHFFFFYHFSVFYKHTKKIWGQTLGALWLLYYINTYPVLSVYEKIPMGPPIFHEIWRSEFGGHLGSWQKGHYFNKKNSEIFHPI